MVNNGTFKKGHIVPQKIRDKISQSKKGKSLAWNKGRMWDEKTKNKMGKNRKGKGLGNSNRKGKQPWNKGLHYIAISREKHWAWKGGISKFTRTERANVMNTLEYKLWRRAVFERDNFTCVVCGKNKVYLNVDHIKPYSKFPKLRFAIDNGRTLCVPCHRKTDTFGGKSATTKALLRGECN